MEKKVEDFIKYNSTISIFIQEDTCEIVIPISIFEKWLKENDYLYYETHYVIDGQLQERSCILSAEQYWEFTDYYIICSDLENMINELNFFN